MRQVYENQAEEDSRILRTSPSAPRDHFTHAIAQKETEKEEQNDITHISSPEPISLEII
jgi:hypothetical protein